MRVIWHGDVWQRAVLGRISFVERASHDASRRLAAENEDAAADHMRVKFL
jgi:hypothetical protein